MVYIFVWNFYVGRAKVYELGNKTDEVVSLRLGKWRNERKCEYERSIDMCKVNEL